MDAGAISGPVAGATISSVVNTTLRLSQVIYEFKAVEEQARDLLNSTKHVSDNVQIARDLRRKKSVHLDVTEKKWIDGVLTNTERTLDNVKSLIEPARVDMQTKFGQVGFVNRSLFVFRDSPKVQTNLARLTLASSSLDQALGVLCSREGRRMSSLSPKLDKSGWQDVPRLARRSTASLHSDFSSPPSYQSFEPPGRLDESPTRQGRRQRCSAGISLPGDIAEHEPIPIETRPSRQNSRTREWCDVLPLCAEAAQCTTPPDHFSDAVETPPLEMNEVLEAYISSQAGMRETALLRRKPLPNNLPRECVTAANSSSTMLVEEDRKTTNKEHDTGPSERLSGRQRQKAYMAYLSSR